MMGVRLVVVLALAGCSFKPGTFSGGDAPVADDDAPGDVPGSELDASVCESWQARHFMPCAIPPPMGGLTLTQANSPYKYVTSTGALTDKNGTVAVASTVITQTDSSMAALISVDSLTVETGALLSVTGDKPLIVASWGPIAIDGTIDVGSHVAGTVVGAGGGAAAYCTGAQLAGKGADDADGGGGSGGGGGGGFRGGGGAGGAGDSNRQNAGGPGGALAAGVPMVVRGGCSGGISGKAGPDSNVSDPNAVSAAGIGGGGLQLSALTSIAINSTGRVLAGGMGGGGSPDNAACGGGGGGAGGYIGLEAPTIVFSGAPVLAANGGGGGASNLFNSPGDAGDDGGPNATRAAGGAAVGGSCSDAGGLGGAGGTLGGAAAANNDVICGGAGGGGGAGHILIFSPSLDVASAVISPAHTLNPF
jgi:hypothetical protein